MLLQDLITQQQSLYTQIQKQIDALQEQQRQIQAFMQQLGSVESKMLSAVQMIQETVADINAVCPDELDNFALTVNDLFAKVPSAMLTSSDSDGAHIDATNSPDNDLDPDPDPSLAKKEPEEDANTIDVTPSSHLTSVKSLVATMSYQRIREVLASYGLSAKGKQHVLRDRLLNHIDGLDEHHLSLMLGYLEEDLPEAV